MCGAFSGFCSLPSPPLAFLLCISVTGACLIKGVGLVAGFSGFASHQCGLHRGAGCQ